MHSNRGRVKVGQWGLISNTRLFLVISLLVIFVMVSRHRVDHNPQETPNVNALEPGRLRSKFEPAEPDIAGILGRTQAYLSTLKRSLSQTTKQETTHQQLSTVAQASLTSKPQMVPLQSPPMATITASSVGSQELESWYVRMTSKLSCLSQRRGAVYLYHVRKAAGTTIRDLLTQATVRWGVPLYETEGVSTPTLNYLPSSPSNPPPPLIRYFICSLLSHHCMIHHALMTPPSLLIPPPPPLLPLPLCLLTRDHHESTICRFTGAAIR